MSGFDSNNNLVCWHFNLFPFYNTYGHPLSPLAKTKVINAFADWLTVEAKAKSS